MEGEREDQIMVDATMHEKFKLTKARRDFTRLLELSAEQQRQMVADPRPFLEQAYKELSVARRLIADITAAANGMHELTAWVDPQTLPRCESIGTSMAKRIAKIQELLHTSKTKQT